jgi:hypothetical protein
MKKMLIALTIATACGSAYAVFGTLVGEKINGGLKYCTYSNGVILTINSYEVCPTSVK